MMPIEEIKDWEQRLARVDAFWDREIIDRPVVRMTLPKEKPVCPWPQSHHASHRERWMDTQFTVECALAQVANTDYLGDALPIVYPNLGPEVFSAFFGQELEYGEWTAWSHPVLEDWAEVDKLQFNEENFYWKKILELMDALLEIGRGKFYTGYTDLHPGGDALAAFRDPANLNMDLLMVPEEVKRLLAHMNPVYYQVVDYYCEKLEAAGQPISSWPPFASTRRWAVPSNDFSCMISREMFDEFFLPGIVEECRHMEANIYHLDGPGALRHLDSLLEVKEINAIQWVYGAGGGRASDWLEIYQKCQTAGKGLMIDLGVDELSRSEKVL